MRGIARFREHFVDHADRYVLIGGAAIDVLMDDAGLTFRATKDLVNVRDAGIEEVILTLRSVYGLNGVGGRVHPARDLE